MSMVIAHNVPALQSYNIVNSTSNALQKSIAKLSSGLRINSAADDAAGLAISEKMRAQVKGLDKAVQNAQDGISLIQTAEGALSETHSMLQRMRELSVQAANDTLTQQDRSYIQLEIDELRDEITRVGNTTQFNKKKLLNGDSAILWSSDDLETKAIVKGGLREIDQFGQKKSVEGNYKLRIKADPGQGEVQKSDIMKIKHENVIMNKTTSIKAGVTDVAVEGVAAGNYALTYLNNQDIEDLAGNVVLTGSYGLGGETSTTVSHVQLDEVNVPITKISVQTTDGVEIWSTTGSDIFQQGSASTVSEATQGAFFVGGTGDNQKTYTGVYKEIIAAAREKGISIAEEYSIDDNNGGTYNASYFEDASSGTLNFVATQMNSGQAVGIKIVYEGDGKISQPVSTIYTNTDNLDDDDPENLILATYDDSDDVSQYVKLSNVVKKPTTKDADEVFYLNATAQNIQDNASILFEVQSVDAINKTVTLKATASKLSQDGVNSTVVQDNIVLKEGDSQGTDLSQLLGNEALSISLNAGELSSIGNNAKFVYFVTAGATPTSGESEALDSNGQTINSDNLRNNDFGVAIDATMDSSWDDAWAGGPYRGETLNYKLDGYNNANKDIHFKSFTLNEKTGAANESDIILSTNTTFNIGNALKSAYDTNGSDGLSSRHEAGQDDDGNSITASAGEVLASFNAAYVGKVAKGDVKLRDLDKFWDGQGVFMLEDAKTITLNQGDGKTANVTLYANDTLNDVARKLNDAIAVDLGQGKYVDDATKFVTFVEGATRGSETVEGTFLLRTVVPGANGEITFSGDENLINAFSLNTIQNSKETSYTVDVSDAHTGATIASSVKVTGNVLHGVINPNVDVEFSALGGINAAWNNSLNKYTYSSTTQETTIHLSDNTTVLQIGANEGEDMGLHIGDMRSHALGLDGVNVMSRERASRSITIIDNAIDKVSTQRARIGAYQNRLEYTVNNLTTASENLTSAESRIRDADMAKEMMEFTKLNIMLQAGNSMLSQANQQPQNVLSLIR